MPMAGCLIRSFASGLLKSQLMRGEKDEIPFHVDFKAFQGGVLSPACTVSRFTRCNWVACLPLCSDGLRDEPLAWTRRLTAQNVSIYANRSDREAAVLDPEDKKWPVLVAADKFSHAILVVPAEQNGGHSSQRLVQELYNFTVKVGMRTQSPT